ITKQEERNNLFLQNLTREEINVGEAYVNTIERIVYPSSEKLDENSIKTTKEIIKSFVKNPLKNKITLKLHKKIINWLDFNEEILTNIKEYTFNIYYIKYIYDKTFLTDQKLRRRNIHTIYETYKTSKIYTKLVRQAITQLSKIKISKEFQPDENPFSGNYKIWNFIETQYDPLLEILKYDGIFTKQFDEVFKNNFFDLNNLIKSLFDIKSYPKTLVKLLKSIDEVNAIQIADEKIVILIVYSEPTFTTARKLNMYIKRHDLQKTKFSIINFSGDLFTRIWESKYPANIKEDVDIISNVFNIAISEIEFFRLHIEINLSIKKEEVQKNSLIWIIWYTECVLRGFNESQIQQIFNILGREKYENYIKRDYYINFISPNLKKKKK
ncbi:hypothetical protein LCGC14_2185460, partial [marine sediment metagenome]